MKATNGTVLLAQKLSKKGLNSQYNVACGTDMVLEQST